ncbi:MAG: hypothetical protein DRR08_08590 [Candidatus Parabeggiatoa sp. nov. 2]|nr:MAG: hypothetical protein B6247_01990 [Beggiatoa sp. 4572_84]RKZ61516.1 MAG: hypothetical protein DRR08_08590 [Gammaproteobacteria bacterium]HEC86099.1 hypothetical protein [Thioploca sp.]
MNRVIASIKAQEKKRHNAIKACLEALIKAVKEHDESGENRQNYLAKLKALKKINEVESVYTPTDYLAGASSIFNLNPQVSASSLLDDALFYQSDTQALQSDWQNVGDDLWSAYFSAEYALFNTKEQK